MRHRRAGLAALRANAIAVALPISCWAPVTKTRVPFDTNSRTALLSAVRGSSPNGSSRRWKSPGGFLAFNLLDFNAICAHDLAPAR